MQRPTTATCGIVGVGAIAEAIVVGLSADVETAPSVLLSPRNADLAASLARRFPTVSVAASNQDVLDRSSMPILALRPVDAGPVLADLRFRPEHRVVSLMAGVSMKQLASSVAPASDITRAIPLPAAAHRESITPLHPPNAAATELFDRLGATIEVADEDAFEAFATATSTIAAHLRYLDEIAGWVERPGISRREASRYVAAIFAGLAPQLRRDGHDLHRLARDHATPGGLNERFVEILEGSDVFGAVRSGLHRIFERLSDRHDGR